MDVKPCPHCGGHNAKLFARSWTVKKHFFVVCVKEKCRCCGPQAESPEEAAEAWNHLPCRESEHQEPNRMKEIVIEGLKNALDEMQIVLPHSTVENMADCVLDDDTGPEVLREEFRRELAGVTVTEEKLNALVWAGLTSRSAAFGFIA